MKSDEKRCRGRSVLPEGAQPCVWMGAGLLAFHLCDRNYDCEHCPLDAALRRVEPAQGGEPARDLGAGPCWEFPEDRVYHRGHLWVQTRASGRLRCGLDVFAQRVLRGAGSLVLPAIRSSLSVGGIGVWVAREDELIPLRSPLDGTVATRNPRVLLRPELVFESPYHEGWLFEVEAQQAPVPGTAAHLTGPEMRQLADRQLGLLRERALRARPAMAEVGRTAADGGELLGDLWALLGREGFRRKVLPFLH